MQNLGSITAMPSQRCGKEGPAFPNALTGRRQRSMLLGEHTISRSEGVPVNPLPALLAAWALTGVGAVIGSILGNAGGKSGLFAGAVLGGVLGVWAAVAVV